MFVLIPPVLFPIIILAFIPTSSGLECFESFIDERRQLCYYGTNGFYATSPENCCNFSKAVAYSAQNTPGRGNIPCNSCKQLRETSNVYCYQEIYWIGERSCHELHLEMTTLIECCVVRGASKNRTAQGFHFQKIGMNLTIPTYSCIPCAEAIIKASEWTAWSPCNSTCDGGYKTRKKICKKDLIKPSYALCVGETTEIDNCNDHPCPHSKLYTIEASEWSMWGVCNSTLGSEYQTRTKICRKSDNDPSNAICVGQMTEIKNCKQTGLSSTIIALVAIISLMAVVVTVLVVYTCCKKKKRPGLNHEIRIPLELSEVRYHKTPTKRDLPVVPSTNSKIEPENHTYADIYANEDNSNGYMPMGGKRN